MRKKRRLLDEYRFPGFSPRAEIKEIFGDPKARLVILKRVPKKQSAGAVGESIGAITIRRRVGYEMYLVGMPGFIWKWRCGEYYVGRVGK